MEDIEEGMKIVALTLREDGNHIARQIRVLPGRFLPRHYTGEVIKYKPNESITIEDNLGVETTFELTTPQKFRIMPHTATLEEGDRVTVIARSDPKEDGLIAVNVWVHASRPSVDVSKLWQFQLRRLESSRGAITDIDEANKTITIDNGEEIALGYDDNTVFVLRGFASLEEAAEAEVPVMVFYKAYDEPEHTQGEAKLVAVKIKLPHLKGMVWKPR